MELLFYDVTLKVCDDVFIPVNLFGFIKREKLKNLCVSYSHRPMDVIYPE